MSEEKVGGIKKINRSGAIRADRGIIKIEAAFTFDLFIDFLTYAIGLMAERLSRPLGNTLVKGGRGPPSLCPMNFWIGKWCPVTLDFSDFALSLDPRIFQF